MIGEDEESCVCIKLGEHLAQNFVDLVVEPLDGIRILLRESRVISRVLRVHQTPEHVRVEVEAREIEEEHAVAEFWKLCIEDAPVLGKHFPRLLEILFIVQHGARERLGIFGDPLCVKLANFVG